MPADRSGAPSAGGSEATRQGPAGAGSSAGRGRGHARLYAQLMFDSCGASHAGKVRANNEDCFDSVPELGFFVVADGLGGAAAGERASELTVKTLVDEVRRAGQPPTADAVASAIELANKRVRWEAENDPCLAGMGCTVTAAIARGSRVEVVSAGDSRAYRYSAGRLEQLTADHTWVNAIAKAADLSEADMRRHPKRHVLTKAVGVEREVAPETVFSSFQPGDILLLCSDGLHGVASPAAIAGALGRAGSLQDKARWLIDATLTLGAPDNVTVMLARHAGA